MNRHYYFNKIISNCYIMLILQGFATLELLMANLNLYWGNFDSDTGLLFIKIILQCVINFILLFQQKKNPTYTKSILIIITSLNVGQLRIYWFGIEMFVSFLGWALIIFSIILIFRQKKYNQVKDEQ